MKRKSILAISMALMILISQASMASAAETSTIPTQTDAQQETVKNPQVADLNLDETTEADDSGTVELPPDGELLDFEFPAEINGHEVTSIGEASFKGCPYFASVTIPSSIKEIGADAFADCQWLTYIVLKDRVDTSGMTLGENWSGKAVVIYGDVLVPDPTQSVIQNYVIKASAGAGGSISPAGEITVAKGSSRTYTIKPQSGYAIKDVVVDGVSMGAKQVYTFPNITGNHTITASFKKKMTVTLGKGTILGAGNNGTLKSGYGFGIRVPITVENGTVSAFARMSNGDTCAVMTLNGNLVFVPNQKSPTQSRIYYVPVATKDGPFTCTVIVTAKNTDDPKEIVTKTVKMTVNIHGSMYEDDFTGDRR